MVPRHCQEKLHDRGRVPNLDRVPVLSCEGILCSLLQTLLSLREALIPTKALVTPFISPAFAHVKSDYRPGYIYSLSYSHDCESVLISQIRECRCSYWREVVSEWASLVSILAGSICAF